MTLRAVTAAAAVLAVAATGCSSGSSGPVASAGATGSASTRAAATRWWTSDDYCTMLRQTLQAGQSVLPGVTAGDPQLLATGQDFTRDLTKAAPTAVHDDWTVLGSAVVALLRSGGSLAKVTGIDAHRVAAAATAIAADARTRCRVDLSQS